MRPIRHNNVSSRSPLLSYRTKTLQRIGTCIGGKIGGLGGNCREGWGGPLRPQPTTAPGNRTLHAKMRDHKYQPIPITYKTFKVFYNKSRTHSSPYVAYLYGWRSRRRVHSVTDAVGLSVGSISGPIWVITWLEHLLMLLLMMMSCDRVVLVDADRLR